MRYAAAVKALGPIDLKSTLRDPLLRWLVVYPIFLGVMIRFGVPWMTPRLVGRFGFDLEAYSWLLMSFMLLTTPIIAGVVIGFLLLDQRDDHTLTALQVTPLTLKGYLVYRTTTPIMLSVAIVFVIFPVAGLVEIGFLPLLAAAIGAGPLAVVFALVLAGFANNKVQGFALAKALGIVLVPAVVAYFVDTRWQLLFGILPVYWPVKFFWTLESGASGGWGYWAVGLAYQGVIIWALWRRVDRVMHR
ncbi:MAG: hypothetical protein O7I93_02300 [Gemmatimonadetes bacterium]|nr:hypothetical protein [Gemmatimonadota bacterium]